MEREEQTGRKNRNKKLPASAKTRRSVLQTSAASLLGLGAIGTATAESQKREFVGVAYDPQTAETFEPATAMLSRPHDSLRGRLKLGNKVIPLNFQTPKLTPNLPLGGRRANTYRPDFYGEHAKGNVPFRMSITSVENGDISGLARHPGFDDRIAFRVTEHNSKRSKKEEREQIANSVRAGGKR